MFNGFNHRFDLLLVVRFLRDCLGHNQLRTFFDNSLSIVGLHKSIGPFHNARFRISKIVLGFIVGLAFLSLLLSLVSLLSFFTGPLFQSTFGFTYLLEPRLTTTQLFWQFVTAFVLSVSSIFFIVSGCGLFKQLADFRSEIPLIFFHPFIAHRLVLGCIRLYLASIKRYTAQLYRTCSQRQLQYLLKQALNRIEVYLSKIRNCTKVWLVSGSKNSEGYILNEPFLDLPRRKHSDTIGIDQYLRHHSRMVRRLAAVVFFVNRFYFREIQLVDHITDKVNQVVLGKPITKAWRQQKHLIWTVRTVCFRHET